MDQLTLEAVRKGGKRALAHALAEAERASADADMVALLDEAFGNPQAHVIGFTGPPGVGKSTLINGLIKQWRAKGQTVGVIAVDPSSQKSGGALLGDRTRMMTDPEDQGVFVRSLASRGQLGGVSELTFPTLVLMRAVFDVVIVETVGVGQSEADITAHADSVVLCVQPGSGDSLQFMKSGIMEIPDIAVVTKADMGPQAERAFSDLAGALSITSQQDKENRVQILKLSAVKEEGLDELILSLKAHYDWLDGSGSLAQQRSNQAKKWQKSFILRDFGQKGLALICDQLNGADTVPFATYHALTKRLFIRLSG